MLFVCELLEVICVSTRVEVEGTTSKDKSGSLRRLRDAMARRLATSYITYLQAADQVIFSSASSNGGRRCQCRL